MKFNLKLFVITFVLSAGSAYAAEQKEDFDNKDFQSFFDEQSRNLRADYESRGLGLNAMERNILTLKPFWYKQWKNQIATNPEESLFYLVDHPDFNHNVFKSEFDQNIEKLIKNKTDINNDKYTNGQTLIMKILERIQHNINAKLQALYNTESNNDPKTQSRLILKAEDSQKILLKFIDVLKKFLPNVNDFYVRDDSGKTVFDYAKGNDEVTELLKSALKELKKKIGELLDTKTSLIAPLQGITLDYLACEK